jgi:hypothetical protein
MTGARGLAGCGHGRAGLGQVAGVRCRVGRDGAGARGWAWRGRGRRGWVRVGKRQQRGSNGGASVKGGGSQQRQVGPMADARHGLGPGGRHAAEARRGLVRVGQGRAGRCRPSMAGVEMGWPAHGVRGAMVAGARGAGSGAQKSGLRNIRTEELCSSAS